MSRYAVGAAAVRDYCARYRDLIDDWPAFAEVIVAPLPTCIWANPARISAAGLSDLLAGEGLVSQPMGWQPTGLRLAAGVRAGRHWWYCAGLAHAQEEASQLPVTLLDLAPGQRVLDLCAAPGGKTAQIAFALDNRGTLLANDFAPERIKALVGNLDRLGVVNAAVTCHDGANYPTAAGQFDRVLADVPCTSEGTLRRNPDQVRRLEGQPSERLAARQRALLRKAVQRCRPGGRVLYSTCTFAPEENEFVVADILAELDGRLNLLPLQVLGLTTAPGVTDWRGRRLDPALEQCLRLWPHQNDTGGFFVALLEKDRTLPCEPDAVVAAAEIEPGDREWLEWTNARFGLSSEAWSAWRIHRQTRRGLHLIAADLAAPAHPRPEGRGLFFQRTNVRPTKLTTAGALLFGPHAQCHRLELDAAQRDAFLGRKTLTPAPAQVRDLTPGQVLVTYRGFALGLAVWHRSGELESLFPRRWSGCTAGSDDAD